MQYHTQEEHSWNEKLIKIYRELFGQSCNQVGYFYTNQVTTCFINKMIQTNIEGARKRIGKENKQV